MCGLSVCVCCLRALPVACRPLSSISPPPPAAVLATDSHKDLLKLINDHRMEVPGAGQGGNGKGVPRPGEVLGRRAVEQ